MRLNELFKKIQLNELRKYLDPNEYGSWINVDGRVENVNSHLIWLNKNYTDYLDKYNRAYNDGWVRVLNGHSFGVQGNEDSIHKTFRYWWPSAVQSGLVYIDNENSKSLALGRYQMPGDKSKLQQDFGPQTTKVNEVIEDNLYHYMSPTKAFNVFSSDSMPGGWIHDIPELGETKGNSFTRNKNFPGGITNKWIRITVDKQKLAQTNKIIPLDAEKIYHYTTKKWEDPDNSPSFSDIKHSDRKIHARSSGGMAEEFVIGDISNLHRAIKKIEIVKDTFHSHPDLASIEVAEEYADKYGIEFIDNRLNHLT